MPVTPALVGQFYTNYLAAYRLPDRVQVNYVAFKLTNFWRGGGIELTNLNDAGRLPFTTDTARMPFPTRRRLKRPKPKSAILWSGSRRIRMRASRPTDFANAVFSVDPVRPENLADRRQTTRADGASHRAVQPGIWPGRIHARRKPLPKPPSV